MDIISNIYSWVNGFYLSTVGYFTGQYKPRLFSEWKRSKAEFENEVKASKELSNSIEEATSIVKFHSTYEGAENIDSVPFQERDASFYSQDNLEEYWLNQGYSNLQVRKDRLEFYYERHLSYLEERLFSFDPEDEEFQNVSFGVWSKGKHIVHFIDTDSGVPTYVDPEDRLDLVALVTKQLVHAEFRHMHENYVATGILYGDEYPHELMADMQETKDTCIKLVENMPTTFKVGSGSHGLTNNSLMYLYTSRSAWFSEEPKNGGDPTDIQLKKYNRLLDNPEFPKFSDIKIKPVFTRFEHEYIGSLYGKHPKIEGIPETAEKMAAFMKSMEFISSLGILGMICRAPANFLDYLLYLFC